MQYTESRFDVQGLASRIWLKPAFFSANGRRFSWHFRSNRPPPVHRLDEQCELGRRQKHLAIHDRRPDKPATLEAFSEQAQASAVVVQHLQIVGPLGAE